MQPKGPVEKGAKASLCLIRSGWVDQREGRKEVAEGYVRSSVECQFSGNGNVLQISNVG